MGESDKKLYHLVVDMWDSLNQIREAYEDDWVQVKKHFLPRKGRGLKGEDQRTDKNDRTDRLDSTGLTSLRKFSHGMFSFMVNPSVPWFKASFSDKKITKKRSVKVWLDIVTEKILDKLASSNFYQAMKTSFQELGAFGTFFMFIQPQMDDEGKMNLRFTPLTTGTYVIDQDYLGKVDTVIREMDRSAKKLVEEFGEENVSPAVKKAYDNRSKQTFKILHAIYPRQKREHGKIDKLNKKYASIHIEYRGSDGKTGNILRVSGFDKFPGMGVRWDATGDDVYGQSPAMDALGDAQMLENMNIDLIKAIHKELDPPLATADAEAEIGQDPGDVTAIEGAGDNKQGVYPITQVRANIPAAEQRIERVQNQVKEIMYVYLFQQLTLPHPQKTATEVLEAKEEKLLMIGPAIERLQNEELKPTIDIAFELMLEYFEIPEWPEPELLGGQELKIEFTSVLAQAQKSTQTGAKDRIIMLIGQLAALYPEALDNLNTDKIIENYANALGVPADEINSPEVRDAIREQRKQAQMNQVAMENMDSMADAVKKTGETPIEDTTALNRIVENYGGGG